MHLIVRTANVRQKRRLDRLGISTTPIALHQIKKLRNLDGGVNYQQPTRHRLDGSKVTAYDLPDEHIADVPNFQCIRVLDPSSFERRGRKPFPLPIADTGIIHVAEELSRKTIGGREAADFEFCWPSVIQMLNQLRQGNRATPN